MHPLRLADEPKVIDAPPRHLNQQEWLLAVRGLEVEFRLGRRTPPLRAVDGVDLAIGRADTLGLVGESGSGKSTIGNAILGMAPVTRGSIYLAGADITHYGQRRRRRLSSVLQAVFQDPYSSLNPTRTIGQTLEETLRVHRVPRLEAQERVHAMLQTVGIAADAAGRFPAQFSGGQRQRIAIARALLMRPKLVICDEPVTALDLSVQAQVLNLLRELQAQFSLSYLFIAHDLAVVQHLSHRVVVLYKGRVMEYGAVSAVYELPAHPYTKALLDAAPVPDPEVQRKRRPTVSHAAATEAPLNADACPFAPRCPHAIDVCRVRRPPLERTPESSLGACHRWRELRETAALAVSGHA
jgi:oligopeptide/dipeptide ABC transporter ATP-binding protein